MAKCNQLTALPFKGLTLSPPIPLRLYSTLCHTGLSHHFFNFWRSDALVLILWRWTLRTAAIWNSWCWRD